MSRSRHSATPRFSAVCSASSLTGKPGFPRAPPRHSPVHPLAKLHKMERGRQRRPLLAGERASSGEGRNRTGDTTVFSRVLYRLSYLARTRSVAPDAAGPSPEYGSPRVPSRSSPETARFPAAPKKPRTREGSRWKSGPVLPRHERSLADQLRAEAASGQAAPCRCRRRTPQTARNRAPRARLEAAQEGHRSASRDPT